MTAMDKGTLMRQLQDVRDNKLSGRDLYSAIHEFGRGHFLEARPVVERFLTHENAQLRCIALEVLINHWRLADYWDVACAFLEQDSDKECRMRGASALEVLERNTQDRRTLSVLARVVCNPQEAPLVRETAYAAMRGIIHYDPREQFHLASKRLNLSQDIDWDMVKSYL